MLQEHIMANNGWHASTKDIEQNSLTDLYPKMHGKYGSTHANMASYMNSFRLRRKTEHGRNRFMIAILQAQFTHHKAFHGIKR